jgi:hemolysin activation/secretion protein
LFAAFSFWAALALAQAPQKPAPEDSPKFEIRRFIFDGATLLSPAQLDRVVRPFVGKNRDFGDVQKALEAVERAYSQAGWSAVQIVLPEQELERGEVRLQVTEAKIGRVLVEGNKNFDEANVRASAPSLVPGSSPNVQKVARNLRIANESPSKQMNALLRSGQEEGTVDAVVRVADEPPVKRSITLDNSGIAQTGPLRVGLGYQNANMFNRDQVLTLQYVGAPYENRPSQAQPTTFSLVPSSRVFVLGAGYHIPLYQSGNSIDLTAGYSNVNSGTVASLFTITGAGGIFGARYNQNLDRIGDYDHRVIYSWDYRGYQNKGVRPVGGTVQLTPDVTVHPVSVTYAGSYRKQDHETSFSVGFSQNLPGGNDGTGSNFCNPNQNGGIARGNGDVCANARYFMTKWSINHSHVLRNDVQLRFAMNGQMTRDMLIPGEQFGLGGADSVRGFLERELTNDNGYRGTAELYTPDFGAKTGFANARVRALYFVDWGGLRRIRPGPAENQAQHIGSSGFGLRIARGNNFTLRVDYAMVFHQGGGNRGTGVVGGEFQGEGKGDGRLHFSMSYVF